MGGCGLPDATLVLWPCVHRFRPFSASGLRDFLPAPERGKSFRERLGPGAGTGGDFRKTPTDWGVIAAVAAVPTSPNVYKTGASWSYNGFPVRDSPYRVARDLMARLARLFQSNYGTAWLMTDASFPRSADDGGGLGPWVQMGCPALRVAAASRGDQAYRNFHDLLMHEPPGAEYKDVGGRSFDFLGEQYNYKEGATNQYTSCTRGFNTYIQLEQLNFAAKNGAQPPKVGQELYPVS